MNNKGSSMDLFIWVGMSLALVLVAVMIIYSLGLANTRLLGLAPSIQSSLGISANVTSIMQNSVGQAISSYNTLKWITGFIIFGMALSILITSFMVRTHPIMFLPYTLVVIIATIFSTYISNVYETLMANPDLASTFVGFTSSNFIFLHLPLWVCAIGILAGILMFINFVRSPY